MPENFYSYLQIFSSILILWSGIIILTRNPRQKINQIFFFLCLTTFSWLFLYKIISLFDINKNLEQLLARISYCGITAFPALTFHYTLLFLDTKINKKLIRVAYATTLSFCLLILKTNLIVNGFYYYQWGPYPKAGNLHYIYLAFFFIGILLCLKILINFIARNQKPKSKKTVQAKYILTGFLIFTLASIDFIPNYGINFQPFGFIPSLFFISIFGYAIIKHQLMDIQIIFKKSIIYSILITLISLLYLIIIIFIERMLQEILGYRSISLSIITAFGLGLISVPLRNKIQFLVDKVFFKNTRDEIVKENELLKQEIVQTERLKSIATLASGMAHEIKNPLTAIKTFCEYLPEKLEDKEFLKKFSRIVGNEVERIDNIVHQLLEFARPSPLALKDIDIHSLMNNILEFLNSDFIKHKIKVSKEFDSDYLELFIEADSNQLRQAFLNIFLNAIDAMKTGGNLSIRTKIASSTLNIAIQDSGPGIKKKDLKHIFDPFYTRKDEGTGLGLSITQRIIAEHRGIIFAESQIGIGTKFIIQLPIKSLVKFPA
ncbi:MAG: ATP-binding protein [Candidatus Omnitrophica bacterium]|nr:ATP-binding protein [Candidatus Omnitrophota bacterium]